MTANFTGFSAILEALFGMIIIHNKARMDDTRYPAKQRQEQAQEKTPHAACHKHRDGREDHAEKITKRFHVLSLALLKLVVLDYRIRQ